MGDNRVEGTGCNITLNRGSDALGRVSLPYGEAFTFRLLDYHQEVSFRHGRAYQDASPYCLGYLYRVGD